ncbi:MAG: dihydrodipicolinate synthase family protein [Candidatus Desulfofervidus auxilii]|nr:dihydrodipicolinate synthase family protein [Candidatus Desulfofervidus auxilii]
MLPKGLICPLLAPLKKSGEIDKNSFIRLWESVRPFVAAIAVGSNFSLEGVYFTYEQKKALFELALNLWDKKIPLFFDITTSDENSTFKLAHFTLKIIKNYFDHIIIEILPLWYRSNRGLPQHIDALRAKTKAIFILDNHPRLVQMRKKFLKHKNIRTAVFKKLTKRDFIKGMVFQGNLTRFLNYQRALHGRDFYFYEADELAFLHQPTSDGIMTITANLIPELWQKIMKKNQDIFAIALAIEKLYQICHTHPGVIKWALMEKGIFSENYTPFPQPLTKKAIQRMKKWMNQYIGGKDV